MSRRRNEVPELEYDNEPVHLVEFGIDVFDRVIQTRDDDMLDGVDTAVGRADDLVQDGECCLE